MPDAVRPTPSRGAGVRKWGAPRARVGAYARMTCLVEPNTDA